MKTYIFLPILFIFTMTMNAQRFNPPATKQTSVSETLHGKTLIDKYRWLEDKTNPEVISWTRSQHDYTLEYIHKNMPEINGLRDEFIHYLDRDIKGAPFFIGNRSISIELLMLKPVNRKVLFLITLMDSIGLLIKNTHIFL
ncbi:MAG: hypothetical protein HYZ54_14295 [Ignavibacteriae bacterium]|nr:hypothetical protein [Ignavibacteriota bacterium]